jgi:hypothetical protein
LATTNECVILKGMTSGIPNPGSPNKDPLSALDALPDTSPSENILKGAANAALLFLKHENPNLYDTIRAQIEATAQELQGELVEHSDGEGHHHLTGEQLRAVVARSVIGGAVAVAVCTGKAQQEIAQLNKIYGVSNEPPTETRSNNQPWAD